MKVRNIHQCGLAASPARVGQLIDTLATQHDALWPASAWPRMELARPLEVGAAGGHGPIRYFVESYEPSRSVGFRFTGPKGFDGGHRYEVVDAGGQTCLLRHTLEMIARGPALLSWPLVYRPLHDALIEDSLALAQASIGQRPDNRRWSLWVVCLRRLATRRRRRRGQRKGTPSGDKLAGRG